MFEQILEQVMPIIVDAVIAIFVILITALSGYAIVFAKAKREEVVANIGVKKYNQYMTIAKDVYFSVEQAYKNKNGDLDKKAEFNKLITEKIPYVTVEDVNHFRESIVGKVNSQLIASELFDPYPDEEGE